MSLKAKLEAVIYAAEEPVTLAQLAMLFTADALEWKTAQAAAKAQPESAEQQPLLDEGFAYLGLEPESAALAAQSGESGEPAVADREHDAEAAASSDPIGGPAPPVQEPASTPDAVEPAADSESDLKREARARDRDVRNVLKTLIDELIASYASDDRGVEIREIAGGYRMATKPECHDAVRSFVRSLKPPLKLSLPALETLAVVAYKQPVTAPEVSEIRGVESAGVLGSLLSRKLIATAGRKQVIGRPILYKTTREFLLRFGLKDVAELPSMEEFEKMAAVELDERASAEEDGTTVESNGETAVELSDSFERTDEPQLSDPAADEAAKAAAEPERIHAEPDASHESTPAETEAAPHE